MHKRKASQESFVNAVKRQVPNWLHHLREHGYAIVPCLLSGDKVQHYTNEFWTWMEGFGTGIDRNKPATWNATNWPPSIRGIIQQYGIGHAAFVWALRTEPDVLNIFETLWGTDDLLVSFDGACLSVPYKKPPRDSEQSWAHIDQGPNREGKFQCAQGLVTFTQAGPGLGGLVVYADSHTLNAQFYKTFVDLAKKVGNSDWCKLEEIHKQWYFDNGAKQIHLEAPPGSLILWDSRTVHWAARPTTGTVPRMAIYVCLVPRSHASAQTLVGKREAFKNRRTTNHWPAQPHLFAKQPRYGNPPLEPIKPGEEPKRRFMDRPTIEEGNVTPKMLSLAGY